MEEAEFVAEQQAILGLVKKWHDGQASDEEKMEAILRDLCLRYGV